MEEEQKRAIEKTLEQATHQYPVDIILEAIREVYHGKLWIVGGFISNIAIPLLHGYETNYHTDIDILLAQRIDLDQIVMPDGWSKGKNFFGNPKFKKNLDRLDVWCLPNIKVIKNRGLKYTLDNYLKTVPLTIQSLVYDVDEKKVYGDIGLKALETKTVGINDLSKLLAVGLETPESSEINYDNFGVLFEIGKDYLVRKAKKLNFTPVLNFFEKHL